MDELVAGALAHPGSIVRAACGAVTGGAWFLVVGVGDAPDPRWPPPWVILGGAIAIAFGATAGSAWLEHLARLAG